MNGDFIPDEFEPPLEIELGEFVLEVLCPAHNERDFEALTESKQHLRATIDPNDFWPDEVTTLEDNLRDLTKDFKEFQDRITFRYAILNQQRTSYDGCLYIRPSKSTNYDCCIEFWFKTSRSYLENAFHDTVKSWLSDFWCFKKMAFPGREISWQAYHSCTSRQ